MPVADFEEREYERPLYHELRVNQNRLWSPGQVLEKRVGFDTAWFSAAPFPLGLYGASLPPGIVPSRFWHFFRHDLSTPPSRVLPDFLLNVFLQAKRPRRNARGSRIIARAGLSGGHWAFAIDSDQQLVLEQLEAKFVGRAIVTYAAPAFHTARRLFAHTAAGTVAVTSTFPPPSALAGHTQWRYKGPGAVGVASSVPHFREGEPLEQRIADLGVRTERPHDPGGDWLANLQSLAVGIEAVVTEVELPESFRRAQYFMLVRELDADERVAELPPWLLAYLRIVAFLRAFQVAWLSAA